MVCPQFPDMVGHTHITSMIEFGLVRAIPVQLPRGGGGVAAASIKVEGTVAIDSLGHIYSDTKCAKE